VSQRVYNLKSGQLPHSCGEVCGKPLTRSAKFWSTSSGTSSSQTFESDSALFECKHKCVDICHPGPCSPCESMVSRSCKCGKSKFQVKCSSNKTPICDKTCDMNLNCGMHKCELVCHGGECEKCQVDVEISCLSHGTKSIVKCGSEEHRAALKNNLQSSCGLKCDRNLTCGFHKCQATCHAGECQPCSLTPSKLTHCPCAKTPMRELLLSKRIIRTSCNDPVPCCDKKCERIRACNWTHGDATVHLCEATCHTGECPPCEKLIEIKCRCGRESKSIKCCEQGAREFLCERKCQKKKSCGKHFCNEKCCPNNGDEHICMQICNKVLSCGLHNCEELCHKGPCRRCLGIISFYFYLISLNKKYNAILCIIVASFEERICHCGHTVQYPPIRCGTLPLDCSQPCARHHSCDHPVAHNCHWDDNKCPPCSYLTSRMCMGEHELRHNIPCHMKDVSCGKPCMRQLKNCGHKCNKTCHKAECLDEGETCEQPCNRERPHCSHKCNAPCHGNSDPCPDTVCQEMVVIKCKCGFKSKFYFTLFDFSNKVLYRERERIKLIV
jgi:transcriptional repressor NF-X1